MNVSKTWVWLLLLSACVRSYEPVIIPEAAPFFLGDASGLYIANHTARSLRPRTVVAVALQDRMLVAVGDNDSLDEALVLTGDLVVDASGAAFFTQTLNVTASTVLPDIARLFPTIANTPLTVEARVDVGFDALTISFVILDTSGRQQVCAAFSSAGITLDCAEIGEAFVFEATKLCDFDARLAGVYSTAVSQTAGPQTCASLAGARQWVVVVANALPIGMVVSVDKGVIEHGEIMVFEPQTLSLASTASVFDLADPVSTQAKLAIDGATTRLRGAMTTASGCGFAFDGVRASGTKSGLLCTKTSLCDGLAYAACPPLPLGLDGIYEFEGELENTEGLCSVPICKLTLKRNQACSPTALPFTQGCPAASSTVLLGSQSASGAACFVVGCAPSDGCSALAEVSELYPPRCDADTFVVRNVAGCVFTTCPAP